jgi:hypothetical protein
VGLNRLATAERSGGGSIYDLSRSVVGFASTPGANYADPDLIAGLRAINEYNNALVKSKELFSLTIMSAKIKKIWIQRSAMLGLIGILAYGIYIDSKGIIGFCLIVFGVSLTIFSQQLNINWAEAYKSKPTSYTRLIIIVVGVGFILSGLFDLLGS